MTTLTSPLRADWSDGDTGRAADVTRRLFAR
jgi:hypothetical protein